jgi:hypothetical protein
MPREYKDYLSTLTAATPDNAADYVQFYDTSAGAIKKVLIGDLTPTGVSTPLNWEGDWITATSYQVGDGVSQDGSSYACLITHTSGTFATDLAASRWQLIAEKGEPGTVRATMRHHRTWSHRQLSQRTLQRAISRYSWTPM